jgi:Macrocin-O-methyltransferase (TylF)
MSGIKTKVKSYLNRYIRDNFVNFRKEDADSFENWVYKWLHFQNFEFVKDYSPKNTYYEFGTGWGGTLTGFLQGATRFCKKHNFDIRQINIVLFDSFQGLPDPKSFEDENPEWEKGKFAYSKDYIINIIKENNFPLENVTFIEGFYEDTLNDKTMEILKKLPPPSIVTMDVDYYSSTMLALNYIHPLLNSGVAFFFDDLYSFFLHPEMGQVKAINEFNQKGEGLLTPLTHMNHCGRCYLYSSKIWEHGRN